MSANTYRVLGLVLGLLVVAALISRRKPIDDPRLALYAQRVSILQAQLAESETEVRHDTDTLRLYTVRHYAVRDTLLTHLTDTLYVKQYVKQTDSTIHACTELANSCEVFRHTATALIDTLTLQRDTYQRLAEQRKSRWVDRLGCFAGYGISGGQDNQVRHGVTVGCGVKVFP